MERFKMKADYQSILQDEADTNRSNVAFRAKQAEKLTEAYLNANFYGTERHYKHPLTKMVYSDGAKHIAETGGAYWLLDIIALKSPQIAEEFQVWNLTVKDGAGILTTEDGNKNLVFSQGIPFTDFPAESAKFFVENGVIFLPSEY
jgi:hypothetical protein